MMVTDIEKAVRICRKRNYDFWVLLDFVHALRRIDFTVEHSKHGKKIIILTLKGNIHE